MHMTKDAIRLERRYGVDIESAKLNVKTNQTCFLSQLDDSQVAVDSMPALSRLTRFDAVDVALDKNTAGTLSVMTNSDNLVIDIKISAK